MTRKLKPEFRTPGIKLIKSRKIRRTSKHLIERIEDIPEGESLLITALLRTHPKQTTPNYLKKGTSVQLQYPRTQSEAIEWQTYGIPFLRGNPTEAIPLRLRNHAYSELSRNGSPRDLSRIILSEPQWGRNRFQRVTTQNEVLEGQRIFSLAHQLGKDITAYIYCDPEMAPEAETQGGKAIIKIPSRYINGDEINFTRLHLPVYDNEFKFAISLLYEVTGHTSGFEFNFVNFRRKGDPETSNWMVVNRYDVAGELAIVKRAKQEELFNSHGHPIPLEMILFPIFNQTHIDFYKRMLDSVLIWDHLLEKPRKLRYSEMVKLNNDRILLRGYYRSAFTPNKSGKVEDQNWELRLE
ncbi:MAG: hypothetical protein AABX29_05890 [Nanoarchaeota archaeon]